MEIQIGNSHSLVNNYMNYIVIDYLYTVTWWWFSWFSVIQAHTLGDKFVYKFSNLVVI